MERAYPTSQTLPPSLTHSLRSGDLGRPPQWQHREFLKVCRHWYLSQCVVLDAKHMNCKITVGFFNVSPNRGIRNSPTSIRQEKTGGLRCNWLYEWTWLCGYWFIARHCISIRFHALANCLIEMSRVFTHTSKTLQKSFQFHITFKW